jgi:hypothetical protein
MAVSATYGFLLTANETLDSGVPAVSNPVLIHDGYNEVATLNASSTPPITQVSNFLLTLTAGAATINLAALTGADGTIDGTGLRVQLIRIKNLGSNSMAFSNGASNGIALACGTITVPAGGKTQIFLNDASPDIAAADRTIDVAGTLVETAEVTIWLG